MVKHLPAVRYLLLAAVLAAGVVGFAAPPPAAHAATRQELARQLERYRNRWRDWQVRAGLLRIQRGIEIYAVNNAGRFPEEYMVSEGGAVSSYVKSWPHSPYTNTDMYYGDGRLGTFRYSLPSPGTYRLESKLSNGTWYVLRPTAICSLVEGIRGHLKDWAAQSSVQVVKEYIDEWAVAHAGTLPAAADVQASGALGTGHAFWPRDPWTGTAMAIGGGIGQLVYTPNVDGTYVLGVHEYADPLLPGPCPDIYYAQ